jgi:Ca2+-binding EF-hand superfamily protein
MTDTRSILHRIAAVALLVSAPLSAQDDTKFLETAFLRLDADKDGMLLRAEFPGSDRQFAAIDADKNAKATLAEFIASEVGKNLVRARYRSKDEPHERVTTTELRARRFDALQRVDANHDGKVTRDEWNGTELAFRELDLDDNAVIDKRDRQEALATALPPEPELPEPKGDLLLVEDLMKRFDKDGNAVLSNKEITDKWLRAALPWADADRDGALIESELRALVTAIQQRRAASMSYRERPEPYEVPFDAWDKDDDERVRQNEWMGPLSLFAQIDVDADAALSRDEVLRYERRVRGHDFVERFDLDGDGKVTLAEFAGPTGAFRRADRSGDGTVTRSDR